MMKVYSPYTYLFIILLISVPLSAEAQFVLNGSAQDLGGNEFLLTPEAGAQVGAIWYTDQATLNESFTVKAEFYFGTKDSGADGITFSLQPNSTAAGSSGQGLGMGGVSPSLVVEFDTYKNGGSDPTYDHVALTMNGSSNHSGANNLAGPTQIDNGNNNVEDGAWYPVEITWDAPADRLQVFVAGSLRIDYQGDVVNSVFGGNPNVYWGFTAATGGKNNLQKIRQLETNLLVDLIDPETITICEGETATINATGIEMANWTSTSAFTQINDSTISTSPSSTSTYHVTNRVKEHDYLINGDFEQPNFGRFAFADASTVPGWETTATDNKIEFWPSGFLGVPSYDGNQFVELNANQGLAALYQDVAIPSGTNLVWSFAHRGRAGVDVMNFEVGPPGGPYQTIGTYSDGPGQWVEYSGVYQIPPGQNTTRFYFTSATGTASGNLLDGIKFYTFTENSDEITVIVESCGCTPPDYSLMTSDTTICSGQSADVQLSFSGVPPFDFYYTSSIYGAQSVLGINSTLYQIPVSESQTIQVDSVVAASCPNETTSTVTVTVNDLPIVNLGNDTTICSGDAFALNAGNPGLNYIWNTSEDTQMIQATSTGKYEVTVSDNIGCSGTDELNLVVNTLPIVDLGSDMTICIGSSLILDARNPGLNYSWNTLANTQTIKVSETGSYSVVVSDAIGCSSSDTMVLTVRNNPKIDLGEDTSVCIGYVHNLDAQNSGYSYLWNTGENSQIISISESGVYAVQVTDEIGCFNSDTFQLEVYQLPSVLFSGPDHVCANDDFIEFDFSPSGGQLTGPGVSNYLLDPKSEDIVLESTTSLNYEYTDKNGCTNAATHSLIVHKNPQGKLDKSGSLPVCLGDSLVLGLVEVGNNTVIWHSNTSESLILKADFLTIKEEGEYYAEISSDFCSSWTDSLNVKIYNPTVQASQFPEGPIPEGNTVDLEVVNPDSQTNYEWVDVNTGEQEFGEYWSFETEENATFVVTARQEHCFATDTITVKVDLNLSIPNTFTPNGDGVYDVWQIDGIESYPNAFIQIFNRWGAVVYSEYGAMEYWDGTINGKDLPMATYYYVIVLNDVRKRQFTGNITIVK